MTTSDVLLIIAVLVAPFLAVFAQRQIDLWREQRQRKLWVFKTLMATRGQTLSPKHVQALNMIELEFQKPSEKPILEAWKEYHDHLHSYPKEGENQKELAVVWDKESTKFLANLLSEMSKAFSYKFDAVQIKKGAYSPQGHATIEMELQLLRRFALEWFAGDRKVSVSIVPKDDEADKQGQQFMAGISGVIEGQRTIRVELVPSPSGDGKPNKGN